MSTVARSNQAEIAKARAIFKRTDLATTLGDAEAKAEGPVTYTVKSKTVVEATGKGYYNDLWGGSGHGTFSVMINVKTGKETGDWK